MKLMYKLAAVHLSDAHYVTDASKFISVVLLSLRAMLQLEMPHINVLSKMDLITQYGDLRESFRYLGADKQHSIWITTPKCKICLISFVHLKVIRERQSMQSSIGPCAISSRTLDSWGSRLWQSR